MARGEAVESTHLVLEGGDVYAGWLATRPPSEAEPATDGDLSGFVWLDRLTRLSGVGFEPGQPLRPVPAVPASVPLTEYPPLTVLDTSYRRGTQVRAGRSGDLAGCTTRADGCWGGVGLQVVGHFDPALLPQGGELGRVPLEEYHSAVIDAADDATQDALGADTLRPDLNPYGYAQMPPSILVPIAALPMFTSAGGDVASAAPVSAVRVRVSGVTGMDAASRERIRLVAERIQQATGLEVDITTGSSQVPQRVALPPSQLGVPALSLDEMWSKKGVALAIADALDQKSPLLFTLILVSAALTVGVSAAAAVQARQRELGTLASLGWSSGRLTASVLLELGVIGLAAGVLGSALAWRLASALGVEAGWWRPLVAVPAALVVTLFAGLGPALRAGRTRPIESLRPVLAGAGSARWRVGGATTLGLAQAGRRPGRVALGALAVALPVAALTLLAGIVQAFQGAVVGSVLGDAVSFQVRTPDLIADAFLAALGAVAVSLILFLGVREDARSYAALSAAGWRDAMLGWSVATQALVIALVGGVVGAGLGGAGLALLAGSVPVSGWAVAAGVVAGALAASVVLALLPAVALARQDTARLLAEE